MIEKMTVKTQPGSRFWRDIKGPIQADAPLAPLTTWKIGGPAQFLAVPQDLEDVFGLMQVAASQGWPLFFLGRGSNVLIDDGGLPGITLHLAKSLQKLEVRRNTVKVGAGVALPRLARTLADRGLGGFEFLAGIPGTVGAAVRLNAGAHGQSLGQHLRRVWVVTPDLELKELTVEDLPEKIRNYRCSNLSLDGNDPAELLTMEEVERRHILRVLEAVGGNKALAARTLGFNRRTLYRNLERYGIGDPVL